MRQYPIWHKVEACIYNSNKSYGSKKTGHVDVLVGASPKDSHHFISHATTCRDIDGGKEFRFYVDNKCVKRCTVIDGIKTDLDADFAIMSIDEVLV